VEHRAILGDDHIENRQQSVHTVEVRRLTAGHQKNARKFAGRSLNEREAVGSSTTRSVALLPSKSVARARRSHQFELNRCSFFAIPKSRHNCEGRSEEKFSSRGTSTTKPACEPR
jgi:hypothetical protein